MSEGPENKDELVDAIYQGEIEPALETRARTTFKPWHKPRKHFVRLNQWCHETRQLIKKLKLGEGGELRYLGLPGEDLLDVRVLKGVCQKAKVTLRYLGFDSSIESPQVNLSRHEVNSDEFIHPSSIVISDRLGDLASDDTIAFKYVDQHAPFDVINLDLCDSVTALAQNGVIPNLEAIRTLCDVQIKKRGQPWLLFLTTRAIKGGLDDQTRQKLFERLLQNVTDNDAFSASMGEKLGFDEAAIRGELQANGPLDAQGWLRAYILAVSKWLLHYMMAHDYKVAVHMLPSYAYSVQRGHRDMASLAFSFEPATPPREDDTGLTRPRQQAVPAVDEMALAQTLIDQVASIEDLDEKLKNDKKLRLKMFVKCGALLATLRYDQNAYKTFGLAD
jgi:hypothetical protein